MTFLAPAILGGLAAAGLPVVIHLLNKSQVRVLPWAAMRFLQLSVKKNERRLRVEDLLLLLLRCLIIALLVLAFARFALTGPPAAGGSGEIASIMVVLDHSASMGYSDGAATRLETARQEAANLVRSLPPGSTAGFILSSDRAEMVIPAPAADLALVQRRIELTSLTPRSADLFPAVQAAVDALANEGSERRREIHIFTDDQAAAWERSEELSALVARNPGILFIPHTTGKRETENTAVTSVVTDVAVPAVGEPVRILATVQNFGEEAVSGLRLTASVNNAPPQDEATVDRLAPGESRIVPLSIQFSQAGFHTVTITSPADRLPIDNQRTLAVEVLAAVRVLLVQNPPREGPPGTGFFLENALLPLRSGLREDHYIKVSTVDYNALGAHRLDDYAMVILVDPPSLVRNGLDTKLEEYVRDGGNLWVLPGDALDLAAVNTSPALAALLPALPKKPEAQEPPLHVRSTGHEHPVTALWNDPAMGSLDAVRIQRRLDLEPIAAQPDSPAGPASVILQYADGSPALIERRYGAGQAVVGGFLFESGWTNLHLHPAFVPVVQRIVSHLTGIGQEGLVVPPGAPFTRTVPREHLGLEFEVQTPEEAERRPAGRVELRDGETVVSIVDTQAPGGYQLFVPGQERPIAAFAVQGPGDAGHLRYADATRIAEIFEAEETANAATTDVVLAPTIRAELWLPLLLAAALLSLVELALAHRFSQAK